jgi:hypothetical protein
MKGDTIEYNTSNIRMQRNAVVDDLLRRLPGLRVNPDGTITYNGEKIQHLLVDGEDIFGSSPTLVTRNFDANKIAKIQVLDRKSDETIFTGIDDGTRTKTLNLVLKEDARNGSFGKSQFGGNTSGYYNANGALAAFRGKEQFTALGIAANTGTLGFTNGSDGTGVSIWGISNDVLGASAGTGTPRFEGAALHYANSWPGDNNHLVVNYQFSHYYTQPISTSNSLQIQPDSIYAQQQTSQSTNVQDQHWVYGIYDWTPNKRSAVKLAFHVSHSTGANHLNSNTSSTINDTLVNSSQRDINDQANRLSTGANLGWRRSIGNKTDQVLSINVTADFENNNTNGYLHSLNRFYISGAPLPSSDTVDQREQIFNKNKTLGEAVGYTQHLWKGALLGTRYSLTFSEDEPLQVVYNRGSGKYTTVVDSLSSRLKTLSISQKATFDIRGENGKLNYSFGGDWIGYSYRQNDLIADTTKILKYDNWNPRLLLTYAASSITALNFGYSASTTEPSPIQLSPIKNNSDPLHITEGNPQLKPAFNQSFTARFHRFNTWVFSAAANLTINKNPISTMTLTDSLGRQISEPVNVQGSKAAGTDFSFGRSVLGIQLGLHIMGSYAQSFAYVNAALSQNISYDGGLGVAVQKFLADKYSLQGSADFNYWDQTSSVNVSAPVRYWTGKYAGDFRLYIVPKYEMGANATYNWQQSAGTLPGTSAFIWNAYVSQILLHDNLVIKFQINNILNANAGITRVNTGNVNTQTSSNILGRYWMFSVSYHFDKKFKNK